MAPGTTGGPLFAAWCDFKTTGPGLGWSGEAVDMIEDPPLLKIRRSFPRPAPEIVATLEGTPTGFLVDCMDGRGALDHGIKGPLPGPSAYFMKSPPDQFSDDQANEMVEDFIKQYGHKE